jgi:metal-dependent amidase/aminoacylase/carboxypeptidase family protein
VLLFQPAEETGTGALSILQDPRFAAIRPDCAIGLHNLPGFPARSIVVRSGTIASASVGLRCDIVGAASHAAHPEDAKTPRRALARLLEELPLLEGVGVDGRLITITHASMGRPGFGVTPGRGEVFATLRARTNEALGDLRGRAESLMRDAISAEGLDCTFRWLDEYPATHNDERLVVELRSVCERRQIDLMEIDEPFRWSDDFGHFSTLIPSVYFGLGIGAEAAGLHQPTYEFPDDVMGTGIQTLYHLARRLAEQSRVGGPLDPESTRRVRDVSGAQ